MKYGVNTKAANNENIIATEPRIGIGAIYGPIIPLTAAIGTSAATTVNVASMVGLPTSLTASTAVLIVILLSINQRL